MKKRKMPLHISIMGELLSVVGSFWPGLAGYFAYRIWLSTPRYKESRRETVWRNSAITESQLVDGKKIVFYRWGEITQDYILLIHGWSGRASQLGAFTKPGKRQGVAVISFDAPGHGASEGHATTIFEIANVIKEVVSKYGNPAAIIAHSFGCMVAAYAIRQYQLAPIKLVTISCPTESQYLIHGFEKQFNLNKRVMKKFEARLFQELGEDLYEKTSVAKNLTGLAIKLLVVHDRDDRIVFWKQSEKLATLVTSAKTHFTNHLGHFGLLRDEALVEEVADFIFN